MHLGNIGVSTVVKLALMLVALVSVIVLLVNVGGGGGDTLDCNQKFQSACNLFIQNGGCRSDVISILDYSDKETLRCYAGTENADEAEDICCFK